MIKPPKTKGKAIIQEKNSGKSTNQSEWRCHQQDLAQQEWWQFLAKLLKLLGFVMPQVAGQVQQVTSPFWVVASTISEACLTIRMNWSRQGNVRKTAWTWWSKGEFNRRHLLKVLVTIWLLQEARGGMCFNTQPFQTAEWLENGLTATSS